MFGGGPRKSEADLFASLGLTSHKPSSVRSSSGSLFPGDPQASTPLHSTPSPPAGAGPPSWPDASPSGPKPATKVAEVVGRPASLPTPRNEAAPVTDDPLSSANNNTGTLRAAAQPSVQSNRSTSSASADASSLPSVFATPLQPPATGSAEAAPPSWQLPHSMYLKPGEMLVDRPSAAQLVKQGFMTQAVLLPGTLYLTNLRVLFEQSPPVASGTSQTPEATTEIVCVYLHSIEKLKKMKKLTEGTVVVELAQKYNARASMRLVLSDADYNNVSSALRIQVKTPDISTDVRANMQRSFAVLHGNALGSAAQRETFSNAFKGWDAYQPEREFHRQGLNNPLSHWRVSTLNQNYKLCPTYPAQLVVPRCVSDDDLEKAAAFRSGRRLPVLCWKDPHGVGSICRSSQPLVGVAKARCVQDEGLLQAIADTNPFNERLQIIDCRPRVNAEVNAAKGKGYEHQAQYVNTKLTFTSIENIHVMRASLRSFLALLTPRNVASAKEDDSYLSDLDKSGWMEHIRKVLRTAATIVHMISVDRASVLVHCSDGWDRTAQVTALAQLLLDSSFRTVHGFQRLLVKEWLSFGHQFALRCGTMAPLERGTHAPSDEECSPVFLQFIECVWQLLQQMPRAFEFNTRYLATILLHLVSSEHGTFLCNCERQRVELGLPTNTTSLWATLEGPEFLNAEYTPDPGILFPNLAASALRPWTSFYCRGSDLLHEDAQTLLENRCTSLAAENARLHQELQLARTQAEAAAASTNGATAATPDEMSQDQKAEAAEAAAMVVDAAAAALEKAEAERAERHSASDQELQQLQEVRSQSDPSGGVEQHTAEPPAALPEPLPEPPAAEVQASPPLAPALSASAVEALHSPDEGHFALVESDDVAKTGSHPPGSSSTQAQQPATASSLVLAAAVVTDLDDECEEEEVFENVRASFGVVDIEGRDADSPEP